MPQIVHLPELFFFSVCQAEKNPTKILYTFLVSPLTTKFPIRGILLQFTTKIKQFR